MALLTCIYYAGISSCGIQGAEKAYPSYPFTISTIVYAFFSAFGGGIIRDTLLLNVYPAAFTFECLPDILVAFYSALFYKANRQNREMYKITHLISVVGDAVGLGQFICIGVDKAIIYNAPPVIVLLSGIVTALGGGIISSFLQGNSFLSIIRTKYLYRFGTIIGVFLYSFIISNGTSHVASQFILSLYTTAIVFSCNQVIRLKIQSVYSYVHNYIYISTCIYTIYIRTNIVENVFVPWSTRSLNFRSYNRSHIKSSYVISNNTCTLYIIKFIQRHR